MSLINESPTPPVADFNSFLAQIDVNDTRDDSTEVLAINAALIALVVPVVGLRIYTRAGLVRRMFLEDYLIIVAAIITIASCSLSISSVKTLGFGKHIWLVLQKYSTRTPVQVLTHVTQLLFFIHFTYTGAMVATKLSIIASYIRIFANNKKFHILMYFVGGSTILTSAGAIILLCIRCNPWLNDKEDDPVKLADACAVWMDYNFAVAILSIINDVILTVSPIPLFHKLQIPKKQKIILCALFAIGLLATVASIMRMISLQAFRNGVDVTYLVVPALIWANVECVTGIFCVSAPTLRPFFKRYTPNIFSSFTKPFTGSKSGRQQTITLDDISHQRPSSKSRITIRHSIDVEYDAGSDSAHNTDEHTPDTFDWRRS